MAPPLLGAGWLVLLSVYTGLANDVVDADIGDVRRAAAMETFITRRFPVEVIRMKVGVVATAIALGLVIGLVADGLIRLRHPTRLARLRRSMRRAAIEAFVSVAGLHAALVLWAMADTPQLYAARWYAQGGLPRTVQILATDWLGTRGVIALTLALAIGFVRPTRLAYLGLRVIALARRPLRPISRARGVAAAAALVVFALGAHEGAPARLDHFAPAKSAASDVKPLNVLILAADSLRDDRLDPKIAPNLMRLAARGTRFDRAYVSLPRTFPSWVSILTGRHGHHHGVRSMFPTWEERAKDFDALPERFRSAGYSTVVVSDYAGDIFSRIDLGFDRIDTPGFDFRQMIRQKALERETPLLPVLHSHLGRKLFPVMRELSAAADPSLLADDIEASLRSVKDKPFFMTVFFSTAHFPYSAPAPYYARFTDPSYRGRFKYHKPIGLGRSSEVAPDADDIRQVKALYDGTVAAIDDGIARVLRTLERLGLAERTILVVTADHGETLFDGEHGQGHGDHLFGDEGTHVPLVIFDPRYATPQPKASLREWITGASPSMERGRCVGRIARDVDLAPTLYELAGIAAPADLDGRSLARAIRGEPLDPAFAYAESELWFTEEIPALPPELRMPYPGVMALTEIDARHNAEVVLKKDMVAPTLMARHRMIRDERFKLLYIPTRVGVRWMLFDTESDPRETTDVAERFPADVARLKAELWAWMLKDPLMEQKDGYLVPRDVKRPTGKGGT